MELNFTNSHLHVYVNKAEHGPWEGYVTGQRLAAPLFFADLSGLLLQVDAVLDEQNFPRAYQRRRTFGEQTTGQANKKENGEYTHAFILHIISRYNTSWQGMVEWTDNRPASPFESELELLRLLERDL